MANSSKIARGTAAKITARKAAAAAASTIKTNRQAALNNAANEAPIQNRFGSRIAAIKAAKSAPKKPAPDKPAPDKPAPKPASPRLGKVITARRAAKSAAAAAATVSGPMQKYGKANGKSAIKMKKC